MTIRLLSSKLIPKNYRLPDNLAQFAEWSLWLKPEGKWFDDEDVIKLANSFAELGMQPILWRFGGRRGRTERISDHLRVFGSTPSLAKNLVLKSTYEIKPDLKLFHAVEPDLKLYSDVAIVPPDSYAIIASSGALSFLPNPDKTAVMWAKIVQGMTWLWLCRDWFRSLPHPALDDGPVWVAYIGSTIQLGGVASFRWSDWANDLNFTLFGDASILQAVTARLMESSCYAGTISNAEASTIFGRGVVQSP